MKIVHQALAFVILFKLVDQPQEVEVSFVVKVFEPVTLVSVHGRHPVLGFPQGGFLLSRFPEQEYLQQVEDSDVLVEQLLRKDSQLSVEEAFGLVEELQEHFLLFRGESIENTHGEVEQVVEEGELLLVSPEAELFLLVVLADAVDAFLDVAVFVRLEFELLDDDPPVLRLPCPGPLELVLVDLQLSPPVTLDIPTFSPELIVFRHHLAKARQLRLRPTHQAEDVEANEGLELPQVHEAFKVVEMQSPGCREQAEDRVAEVEAFQPFKGLLDSEGVVFVSEPHPFSLQLQQSLHHRPLSLILFFLNHLLPLFFCDGKDYFEFTLRLRLILSPQQYGKCKSVVSTLARRLDFPID